MPLNAGEHVVEAVSCFHSVNSINLFLKTHYYHPPVQQKLIYSDDSAANSDMTTSTTPAGVRSFTPLRHYATGSVTLFIYFDIFYSNIIINLVNADNYYYRF